MFLEDKTAQGAYSSRIARVVTQDICTFWWSILPLFFNILTHSIFPRNSRKCCETLWQRVLVLLDNVLLFLLLLSWLTMKIKFVTTIVGFFPLVVTCSLGVFPQGPSHDLCLRTVILCLAPSRTRDYLNGLPEELNSPIRFGSGLSVF